VYLSQQAQAVCGISSVTWRFRASDGSRVDMKSGLRELTALSVLAAFFVVSRGLTMTRFSPLGASAMTIIEAIGRLR